MKKKNILKIICCLCMVVFSTFMFVGCGGSNPVPGYTSGSSAPEPEGGFSDDSGDVEVDEDGNMPEGTNVADFSDYFSGYITLTKQGDDYEVHDEISGKEDDSDELKTKLFNDLVERQIEIFTQDILFRLCAVYGGDYAAAIYYNRAPIGDAELHDGSLSVYSLNGNEALFRQENVIMPTVTSNNDSLLDITDSQSFQNAYANIEGGPSISWGIGLSDGNIICSDKSLFLSGAITGYFMRYDKYTDDKHVLLDKPTSDKQWKTVFNFESADYYGIGDYNSASFKETKNKIKLAFAKIFAGLEVDDEETDYNKVISKVINLGLFDGYKEKVIDYIYKEIIGEQLVTQDDVYKDYLIERYDGKVSLSALNNLEKDSEFAAKGFNQSNSPRFYKGYTTVVPALVDQVFNHTFTDTDTSIFPLFKRVDMVEGNFDTVPNEGSSTSSDNGYDTNTEDLSSTGYVNLESIILKPKDGVKPLAISLQLSGARKEQDEFIKDIVIDFEIVMTYYKDGIVYSDTVTPDYESGTIMTMDTHKGCEITEPDYESPDYKADFDPNNPLGGGSGDNPVKVVGTTDIFTYSISVEDEWPAMGEYDGEVKKPFDMSLFDNSFINTGNQLSYYVGESYIEITLNIVKVQKYTSSEYVDLEDYDGDVYFDLSIQPYTK